MNTVVSAAAILFLATPIAASEKQDHPPPGPSTTSKEACGFKGDADMYGLGIRLGIYLQVSAMCICAFTNQTSTFETLHFGITIFKFAMAVGLIYLTASSSSADFQAIEAAMIVLLALCLPMVPFTSITRTGLEPTTALRKVGKGIVSAIHQTGHILLLAYSVWFWYVGLDRLARAPCTGYAFFFAKVNLYGWLRTLGKVYITLLFVITVVGLVCIFFYSSNESSYQVRDRLVFYPVTAALIFFMLSVELMIRWNKVTGVNELTSVSQLVAFMVGLGSLISVAAEWKCAGRDSESEEGQSLSSE